MPQQRKPPIQSSRRPDASLPSTADPPVFHIESTTVRLKSMRLRRAEREQREAGDLAEKSTNVSVDLPRGAGPSGRVRHDARGVAVWDWGVASGEFATLSTTRALKKLEVSDLKIEDTIRPTNLRLEVSGRDKGGGFDPYNQRGSGKREGEAAKRQGVTGAADRAGKKK